MSDAIASRLEILEQLADRMEQRRADFIAAEAVDIGTPCSAVAMEMDMAVSHLRTMALEGLEVEGLSLIHLSEPTRPY